jgi:hypothetical protein
MLCCLTIAYRWWDFGADAYVVRRSHFSLPEKLSHLPCIVEFQQIRSVDTQCRIADGTYFRLQVSSLISGCIRQGWLWSRLPLTATNFIVEVEFKVRNIVFTPISVVALCLVVDRRQ